MPNPIASLFNGGSTPVVNKPQQMSFLEFAKQYSNSNPREIVQNLLYNGQMSQEQFNQFSKIANSLTGRK